MIVMKWERPGIGSSSNELLGSWKTRSCYISKPDYSKTQIPVWCIFFKVSKIYSNYFSKAIKINTDFHRSINMKPRRRPSADILKKKKRYFIRLQSRVAHEMKNETLRSFASEPLGLDALEIERDVLENGSDALKNHLIQEFVSNLFFTH